MSKIATVLLRGLAVIVPAGAGVLSILFSGTFAQAPQTKEKSQPPVPVRILTLAPVEVTPRVTGYGMVAPARDWRAVARVEGEVIETSPLLANGQLAPKGTVLLRIDDTDLKLALAQIDAQAAALVVKDETLMASLSLSRSDLALSQAELDRQKRLQGQGVATQAQLDQAGRVTLSAQSKVTEIENQLALNKAEREVLAAQRAIAARNLDFATIAAPYDLRIDTVSAELGQVVTRGATLVAAEGTEAAEVTAQFPIGRIGPVVRGLGPDAAVTGLRAVVRLSAPGHEVSWHAMVDRVGETIDPRTQSAGIVVRVADPLDLAQPGVRPELRRGMFVVVELSAPPRKALAVPAAAIQGGQALVVTADDRLEQRAVRPAYMIDGVAIIADGLKPGDRLVVTDPSIALPGMAVKPVEDKALKAEIAAAAKGN
ncbi:efflux RND transporter periplasmic adaptor subunit [Solirhodobacter olei]|uniref:efflux RND transporter periplasmic adaptor subunit n=1 Tax=Solirhodobacter olei TaxID=2493082 RepID=UPI000FDBD455|nr:HlyD family efflux transporter periplasmic adaptor subunit [Solirhodobacter olei]